MLDRDARFKWDHDTAYRKRTSAVGAALVRGNRSAAAKAAAEAVKTATAPSPATWADVDALIARGEQNA